MYNLPKISWLVHEPWSSHTWPLSSSVVTEWLSYSWWHSFLWASMFWLDSLRLIGEIAELEIRTRKHILVSNPASFHQQNVDGVRDGKEVQSMQEAASSNSLLGHLRSRDNSSNTVISQGPRTWRQMKRQEWDWAITQTRTHRNTLVVKSTPYSAYSEWGPPNVCFGRIFFCLSKGSPYSCMRKVGFVLKIYSVSPMKIVIDNHQEKTMQSNESSGFSQSAKIHLKEALAS